LKERIMLFFVDLDYENIPELCNHCRKIGHNTDYYKILMVPEVKEGEEVKKKNVPQGKIYGRRKVL